MIVVEFEEDALRHYCAKFLPEVNNVLRIDHLRCAFATLSNEPCPFCESFNNSIKEAIMRLASRRLTNIPMVDKG